MATTSEDIQAAVDSLEENTQALDDFIEGGPTDIVTTPDGNTYPTLAKLIEDQFTPLGSTYVITAPAGGELRTFDPNTANMGEIADVLATLISDLQA